MEKDFLRKSEIQRLCKFLHLTNLAGNVDPNSNPGIIIQCCEMNDISKQRADRELKKGTFILFIKKLFFMGSVTVGKWIAKHIYTRALKHLGIKPHEFSQMLNHNSCYITTFWSHFQPFNGCEDFLNCTEEETLAIIMDAKSFIETHMEVSIKDFADDEKLRCLVLNKDNMTFPKKLTFLMHLHVTMFLHQTDLQKISVFYESITSKKFLLGYRGISFDFVTKESQKRQFFMHVASCFKTVTFFINQEMLATTMQSYEFFEIGMNSNLDSLSYNTA